MNNRRILLKTIALFPFFSSISLFFDEMETFANPNPDYLKISESLFSAIQNANIVDKITRQKNIHKIAFYEELLANEGVPRTFRLPLDLVSIRKNPQEVHLIPAHKNICFLPNVDILYLTTIEFYKRYKAEKEKKQPDVRKIPSMETVLSIMCQETWFRTHVKGDGGRSVGMAQLFFPTAKYLLETPKYKVIFENQFELYNDTESGKLAHRFKGESQEDKMKNMIAFVFDFLLHCQKFRAEAPLKAIKKYNGGSATYAKSVIRKIIQYKMFVAQCLETSVDYRKIENSLKYLYFCNNDLSQEFGFNDESQLKIFRSEAQNMLSTATFAQPQKNIKLFEMAQTPIIREEKLVFEAGMPVFYVFKTADKSLFTYFKENLFSAVCFHNEIAETKEKISLFVHKQTEKGNQKIRLNSEAEFLTALKNKENILSNVRNGAKIYVNPTSGVYIDAGESENYVINLTESTK